MLPADRNAAFAHAADLYHAEQQVHLNIELFLHRPREDGAHIDPRALGKRAQCVEIAGGEARHLEGGLAREVGDAGEARRGTAVGESCGHHCL